MPANNWTKRKPRTPTAGLSGINSTQQIYSPSSKGKQNFPTTNRQEALRRHPGRDCRRRRPPWTARKAYRQLNTLPKVMRYFGARGLATVEAEALGYRRIATRIQDGELQTISSMSPASMSLQTISFCTNAWPAITYFVNQAESESQSAPGSPTHWVNLSNLLWSSDHGKRSKQIQQQTDGPARRACSPLLGGLR